MGVQDSGEWAIDPRGGRLFRVELRPGSGPRTLSSGGWIARWLMRKLVAAQRVRLIEGSKRGGATRGYIPSTTSQLVRTLVAGGAPDWSCSDPSSLAVSGTIVVTDNGDGTGTMKVEAYY